MSSQLPSAVSTYFEISNGSDTSGLAACFRADATVIDESATHEGLNAIQTWQREVQKAFAYQVQPLRSEEKGGKLNVMTRVVGNFPGSPVELNHAFVLAEGQIQSLEITP